MEIKYLTIPPSDWGNGTVKQKELLDFLASGWEIVSATGAGEVVHYIIIKTPPKKSPGRPKAPQERS